MLTFKAHKCAVTGLAFSPDGRILATAVDEELIQLWDLSGPTEVRQFPGSNYSTRVAFSPDGRFLAIGGNELAVFETASERCVVVDKDCAAIAFAPDSKEVATIALDETLRRWVLPKGKALVPVEIGEDRDPTGLAYSPDGKTIAVAFDELVGRKLKSHVLLFRRDTGTAERFIAAPFPFGHPKALAYSPDGELIAGIYGPVLGVLNAKTREPVRGLRPGKKYFNGFAFTPDGQRLIAVNNDAAVRVYDTATWKEVTGYEWQIGKLTAVAVAPDGLRAACGSHKGQVIVWDLE